MLLPSSINIWLIKWPSFWTFTTPSTLDIYGIDIVTQLCSLLYLKMNKVWETNVFMCIFYHIHHKSNLPWIRFSTTPVFYSCNIIWLKLHFTNSFEWVEWCYASCSFDQYGQRWTCKRENTDKIHPNWEISRLEKHSQYWMILCTNLKCG